MILWVKHRVYRNYHLQIRLFLEESVDFRIFISWFEVQNFAIAPFLFCFEAPFLEIQVKPSSYAWELEGSSLSWNWEYASEKLDYFWLMNCFGEILYSKLLPSLFCKMLYGRLYF